MSGITGMRSGTATDFAVIGGGLVGASLGYGLALAGERVTVFDQGDVALRAARGNFGNVWVQGKGTNGPAYADLTRATANDWASFALELEVLTGLNLHFRRPGGFYLCFAREELDRRVASLTALATKATIPSRFEVLNNAALKSVIPDIGPGVAGATYCPDDGTANPLHLLRALLLGLQRLGGKYLANHDVRRVAADGQGFLIETAGGIHHTARIALTAGLGNVGLAASLGLRAPVRPVRGQILVTEKVRPFLQYGMNFVRQTVEGGCIFGESSEEVGFDEGTTSDVLRATAKRAVAAFPLLEHVRVIRSWGALRVMSADGMPIYQQSAVHSGAFLLSVHSGVTLAPFHARSMAQALKDGALSQDLGIHFSPDRFDVPTPYTT